MLEPAMAIGRWEPLMAVGERGAGQALREPPRLDHAAAILACAAGDRAALRRLYDAEAGQLLAVALRIVRRRDLAQDIVQDAFVQVWTRAASFDPTRGSARGWLYAIVRHRALNTLRDGRFETALDDVALAATPDPAPLAPAILERLAENAALRRCLEALEETRRQCLLLAYGEGLTHSQIADRVGAPLGTVKAWIRRGLLTLRACLT